MALLELITQDRQTTSQLHSLLNSRGVEVNKRMVQRDLLVLEATHALMSEGTSPRYWWRTAKTKHLLAMDASSALTLKLVQGVISPLLPQSVLKHMAEVFDAAQHMLAKLERGDGLARWPAKVAEVQPTMPLLPPHIEEHVLTTIQDALLCEHGVEVSYRGSDGNVRSRQDLLPLGFVQSGSILYLVAQNSGGKPKTYAVHRILSAKPVTTRSLSAPEGFSLQEYLDRGGAHFGAGTSLRLEMRVSGSYMRQLQETRPSVDQHICLEDKANDIYRVSATVSNTWRLRWWLLSKLDEIEVLQPLELRTELARLIREATARYTGSPDFPLRPYVPPQVPTTIPTGKEPPHVA